MKKALVIWSLLLAVVPLFAKQDSTKTHYELAYRLGVGGGMMMPDGKVDQWIQRPLIGGSYAAFCAENIV